MVQILRMMAIVIGIILLGGLIAVDIMGNVDTDDIPEEMQDRRDRVRKREPESWFYISDKEKTTWI